MGFKDLFKIDKITKEDENLEYLISKLIGLIGINKAYKLIDVTPGAAALLKKKYKGEYYKDKRIFFINPNIKNRVYLVSCTEENLQKLLVKKMKGED